MLLMTAVISITIMGCTSAATVTVGTGGGYNSTTINGGITLATVGDSVVVYPGTYTENVALNKANINLTSSGTGTATIRASVTANPVITVSANNTIINGFNITGSNTNGIQVNTNMYCNITNNNIYSNSQNGINIVGGTSHVTIANNNIYSNTRNGINIDGGTNTINNNTIHENSGNTGSGYANIMVNSGTNTISNNVIYNVNGLGDDGIRIPGGTNTLYNNEIYGCEDGIDVEGGLNTITSNILRNNREDGVNIDSAGTGLTISFNYIYGNGQFGIQNNQNTANVVAENNWWGHNTAPTTGTSYGSDISTTNIARVDYNPWLVLTLTSSPDTINIGNTSTITADFSYNSDGVIPTPPSTGSIFPKLPVTFTTTDSPALGSLNPTSTYINSLTAKATSTFTGTSTGLAHITVTVGSYTQQVTVKIISTTISVSNKLYSQLESITPIYGSEDYYYVTVKNTGTDTAKNVVVNITMTPGLSAFNIIEWWVSWDNQVNYLREDSSFNSTTGVWTVGDLAAGQKVYLDIRMIIQQTGAITNTATGTADNAASVAKTYSITVPTSSGSINLGITNSFSNTSPSPGSSQTLTIGVTNPNNSGATATGVIVNDGLPAGLTITGWAISTNNGNTWTYYTPGQSSTFDYWTGVWNIGNLSRGNNNRNYLAITFTVPSSGTTQVLSTVYGSQYDSNLANNIATATYTPTSTLLAASALTTSVTTFDAMSTTEGSGTNDNLGSTPTTGDSNTNSSGSTSSGSNGTTSTNSTQDNGLVKQISDLFSKLISLLKSIF